MPLGITHLIKSPARNVIIGISLENGDMSEEISIFIISILPAIKFNTCRAVDKTEVITAQSKSCILGKHHCHSISLVVAFGIPGEIDFQPVFRIIRIRQPCTSCLSIFSGGQLDGSVIQNGRVAVQLHAANNVGDIFFDMHSAAAVLTVHFSDVQQILLPGIQTGCEPEIISLSAFVIPADLLIISVVQVCLCIVVGFCIKHIFAVVLRREGEWHPPGLL